MSTKLDHDVIVVGASLAGCTTALLYARRGARVALVERHPDPGAWKRSCTHLIQPGAVPALQRTGLAEVVERAGGVRTRFELSTPWGWIRRAGDGAPFGYNVRRECLDPLLRRLAADAPGVELMLGQAVTELRADARGVVTKDRAGRRRGLAARLVVAADGRDSTVARLAGARPKTSPNNRFVYFAYYSGPGLAQGEATSRVWLLDPEQAYALPQGDGSLLVAHFVHRSRLPEWRSDPEERLLAAFRRLPLTPALGDAERVSPLMGRLDMPNLSRPAAAAGIAYVGHAAVASDPAAGVGCGWAFQSAEWLVDATVNAVLGAAPLGTALLRHRRRHRAEVLGHHRLICEDSRARPFNPLQRLLLSAGVRDERTAEHLFDYFTRRTRPREFLAPRAVVRAACVGTRGRRAPHSAAAAS